MKESVRITWSRPLAIHSAALEEDLQPRGVADRGFATCGDAAVVTIRGPLLVRASGFWSLFCDDYDAIRERVAAALASGQPRVILRIDSPGGDAFGCLELARELRAMAAASGKKMIAFGEGMIASAAYAIASACDEIHVQPTTLVGSIGVITERVDVSGMDRALGVVVTLVSSGVRKTDGNPHAPTSEAEVARTQAMIDELADLFFGVVQDHRGVPVEETRALDGGLFVGASAVGARIADRVSTWADVVAGSTGAEAAPMANSKKSFDAAKEALRAVVDDEGASSDEREKARKSLRALEAEGEMPEGDDDKKDDKDKDGMKSEDNEDMRAADYDKDKDMRAGARAATSSSVDVAAIARKAALEAVSQRERVQAEQSEVRDLLATRPDFDAKMRATLAKLPVSEVRAAVSEWPRRGAFQPAAAASAMPTVQGDHQGDLDLALDPETTALMNRVMRHDGSMAPRTQAEAPSVTFDFAAARERVAKLKEVGR